MGWTRNDSQRVTVSHDERNGNFLIDFSFLRQSGQATEKTIGIAGICHVFQYFLTFLFRKRRLRRRSHLHHFAEGFYNFVLHLRDHFRWKDSAMRGIGNDHVREGLSWDGKELYAIQS